VYELQLAGAPAVEPWRRRRMPLYVWIIGLTVLGVVV